MQHEDAVAAILCSLDGLDNVVVAADVGALSVSNLGAREHYGHHCASGWVEYSSALATSHAAG